jgi:hypothetical protein
MLCLMSNPAGGSGEGTFWLNVTQSVVNAACFSEVLITSRMPEEAAISCAGVLRALTNTQWAGRLKLAHIRQHSAR